MPSLSAIRAFDAVVRLGSMEKAGNELALTASAIGKRIACLEEQLGVQLLSRCGRGVMPTAAGLEYLEQVRKALDLLSAVALHSRQTPRLQRLQVCVPPTFARQVLVPHLEQFLNSHQDIELEITMSLPYLRLQPSGVDVEVVASQRSADQGEELLQEQLRPMCTPAQAQSCVQAGRLEGLQQATLIRCPMEPWGPWFKQVGLDWPEPTSGPLFVDNGLALEAAVSGLGIVLARPSMARRWLSSGRLVTLFDVGVTPSSAYSLVRHARAEAAPCAEVFACWLTDLCTALTNSEAS